MPAQYRGVNNGRGRILRYPASTRYAGGSGVITFRVPSESDAASTIGLLITFPAATPFTSVDVQPKAGWTAKVTKKPLPVGALLTARSRGRVAPPA